MAALDGRVPENALLSHDLFEGLYARTALVTDVEVVDDYPASVLAHARRQHRWVRGDWQILWWLFPFVPTRVGPAPQPPAAHLALEDPRQPAAQPGGARDGRRCCCSAGPCCPGAPRSGRPPSWPRSPSRSTRSLLAGARRPAAAAALARLPARVLSEDASTAVAQVALQLTFLANQACEMVHAIVLTLVRLGVTQRRLLEWETAAASAARGRRAASAQARSWWRWSRAR